MESKSLLDEIEVQVKKLVAENLRSNAALIKHVYTLITHAQDLGYSHQSIYEHIKKGGLDTTFRAYETMVYRIRKSIENGKFTPPNTVQVITNNPFPDSKSNVQDEQQNLDALQKTEPSKVEKSETKTATASSDTLKNAEAKLKDKDYSKFARNTKTRQFK